VKSEETVRRREDDVSLTYTILCGFFHPCGICAEEAKWFKY
jgi:hypothetical protein